MKKRSTMKAANVSKGKKRGQVLTAFLLFSALLIIVVDGLVGLISFPFQWYGVIKGVISCPSCSLKFIKHFPWTGLYVYWNVLGVPIVATILLVRTIRGYKEDKKSS